MKKAATTIPFAFVGFSPQLAAADVEERASNAQEVSG